MDYPGITEVIQVGLTDRESYIHRLGRTARAGREGAGLLIVSEPEARALLPELADLPIIPAGPQSELTGGIRNHMPGFTPSAAATAAGTAAPRGKAAFLSQCGFVKTVGAVPELSATLAKVSNDEEMVKEASQAYGASLGFYNG